MMCGTFAFAVAAAYIKGIITFFLLILRSYFVATYIEVKEAQTAQESELHITAKQAECDLSLQMKCTQPEHQLLLNNFEISGKERLLYTLRVLVPELFGACFSLLQ